MYARKPFFFSYNGSAEVNGAEVIATSTIMHKYLETPVHAFTSFLDLFRRSFDVALLCNAANAPFSWMMKLKGLPFALNVDGVERNRAKWNKLGRLWYSLGEISTLLFASRIVADAEVISDYWIKSYGVESEVIPYGADGSKLPPGDTLKQFLLSPNKYILYVSRLEPENNALGVIEAYGKVETDIPLVIVGDAPYAKLYIQSLKTLAEKISINSRRKVIFTGYQFGDAYRELQSNCLIYIQATEVGGTHPALIESMAFGNCVIANGTPENREVLGDSGLIYSKNNFEELAQLITKSLKQREELERFRKLASVRASQLYSWERVTDCYEELFRSLVFSKSLVKDT